MPRGRTGWRPGYPDEIDPDIPQGTLRRARFGIYLIRYPDDDELQPGHDLDGHRDGHGTVDEPGRVNRGTVCVTGEILWIDAAREWAVCEDGFWWTPAEE